MALSATESVIDQDTVMGAAVYAAARGPIELIPNPDFIFPARPDHASSRRTQSSSIARRPRSEQNLAATANPSMHQNRASVSALPLPSFSFNPAGNASQPPSVQSTPPQSPTMNAPSTPSRSRHRRGGSELIGGDRATGSVHIISTSPKQADFTAAPPATIHLGPPAGRRHAHRRSGAISCHDLASIVQPKDFNTQARSGSAPTSPLDIDQKGFNFPIQVRRSSDQSIQRASIDETMHGEDASHRRPPSRARVGFADRVEYIRPLSTISSETEGSMSTIRGHSVTGSWSSVVSTTNPSPARILRPSLNTTFEDDDAQRPATSQAIISSPNTPRFSFGLEPTIEERPRSEAGLASCPPSPVHNEQPKRKSFGWWESKAKRPQLEPSKASSDSNQVSTISPPVSPKAARHSLDSDQETIKCALAGSERKKPRKVRSWAHSLISRKHKSKKDYRPATPPASSGEQSEDTDDKDDTSSQSDNEQPNFDFNFDEDNTVTIVNQDARQSAIQIDTIAHPSDVASDVVSPVIDLDVAMSPFNTQFNQIGRGSRQVRTRRSMHSASLTSGAFNLASQHRRTESAPELVPFELRNTPAFAPSVMPDVFEEEDEELAEEDDVKLVHSPRYEATEDNDEEEEAFSTESQIVEGNGNVAPTGPWPSVAGFGSTRRKKSEGLSIETGSRPSSMVLDNIEMVQSTATVRQSMPEVEVVEPEDIPRDIKPADDSTSTLFNTKNSIQVPLRYALPLPPQSIMTPDTISDTSMYSPFFSPSQASFEGARLDTGASSLTDAPTIAFGEPGPELRNSVDDVPSLSSSRSTMTSPAVYISMPGSGRANSVYSTHSTATADFSAQKRASIASLSRLVSDRFERSKLSIETRPVTSQDNLTMTPKRQKSRHRLSKLMQFWKSKETV